MSKIGVQEAAFDEQEPQEGASCPSGRPVDHYKPSGRKYSKKELNDRLTYAAAKQWSLAHKRQFSPLPLPEATERRIRQWFELVDDDGSGQLDAAELEFALKASGIPASSSAIMEIIGLFDFDRDGEIAWREFHNFLSHEVMADKDPLGSEYVLPSGVSLPLGSMIGAIRRRKIITDVEKGGTSRDFWVAEGPEFLRYLLESERYKFDQQHSREVIHRILSYNPPPRKEADPEAVEQHKRRIEKLKLILLRTASGRSVAAGQNHAAPSAGRKGHPKDADADADAGGNAEVVANKAGASHRLESPQRRGTTDGARSRASADGSTAGSADEGKRSTRARFANALAAAEAAFAAAKRHLEAERMEAGTEGAGADGALEAGAADSDDGETRDADSEAVPPSSNNTSDRGGMSEAAEAGMAIELAAAYVAEMCRLEEVLEQHHQRTGTPKPNQRAGIVRHPVVVPLAAVGSSSSVQTSRQPTACGNGLDAGDSASWSGTAGGRRPAPPSSSRGPTGNGSVLCDGDSGGWSTTAGRRAVPPTPSSSRGPTGNGSVLYDGDGGGWSATAGKRAVPPTPSSSRGPTGNGSVLYDGDGGGWSVTAGRRAVPLTSSSSSRGPTGNGSVLYDGEGGGWSATAARQHAPPRLIIHEQQIPDGEVPEQGADSQSGSGWDAHQRAVVVGADGGAVRSYGNAGEGSRDGDSAWDIDLAASFPSSDSRSRGTEVLNSGAGGGTAAGPQDALQSSPQPSVPRLAVQLVERSLSTGRGPYSARLIRTARANGHAHGSASPWGPGGGEGSSLSGAASMESSTAAAGGVGSGGISADASIATCCIIGDASVAPQGPRHVPAAPRAASFTLPQPATYPRLANVRAEAAAAAAEIRRQAWCGYQQQQHGGWPQASPSASMHPSSSGSAVTPCAGQPPAAGGAEIVGAARFGVTALGQPSSSVAMRHSADFGERSPHFYSSHPDTPAAAVMSSPGGAVAPAQYAGYAQPTSAGGIGVNLRLNEAQPPMLQRVQVLGQAQGQGLKPTHVSHLSPTTGQTIDRGVEVIPLEWMCTSPQPRPPGGPVAQLRQPSFRNNASVASSQRSPPLGATPGPAAAPASGGRRSFDLEPRPGGWRAAARSPSAAVLNCQPPAVVQLSKESGFAWMKGRLMRTCLAASLRTTGLMSSSASSCSQQTSGNTGGAAGNNTSSSGAAASGAQLRSSSGSTLPAAGLGAAAMSGGENAPGVGAQRAESGRRSFGVAFGGGVVSKPTAAQVPGVAALKSQQRPQGCLVPAGCGAEAGHTAAAFESAKGGTKWPWPWKEDMAAGAKESVQAGSAKQGGASSSRPMHVRASMLRPT